MNPLALRRPTLLVMHPDPLLRAGLVAALRQHPLFQTFDDQADAVAPDRPRIDVVITDHEHAMRLARPGQPPRGALAAARILVVTRHDREAEVRRAIEAGIHGYILLGASLDELIDGASTVARGLRFMSRAVAQCMADSLAHAALTSRETEVLSLVAGGESNKAIARDLEITVGTVKTHMTAIMAKLGASSRTQAASIAAARGLVQQQQRASMRRVPARRRAGALAVRALAGA